MRTVVLFFELPKTMEGEKRRAKKPVMVNNSKDGSSKTTTTAAATTTANNSFLTSLINLDNKLSLQIHTLCTPIPRSIFKALECLGDGCLLVPIPIALFLSPLSNYSNYNLQSTFIGLFVGFILDLICVGLCKYTIRRPRPMYNKDMKLTVSFGSSHFYLYLSSAAASIGSDGGGGGGGKFVNFFVLICCLWSAATSVSGVLLGRHFVFDVVAGVVLGFVNALLVFKFCNI
ncbi:hypothetical protein MKW98_019404 [Papaver atlanticum]|uniref:Phosphatidic acid phosphatase type 2/haloperoxidase domain-containing protein n=1 Tax=Papaver atlanticum TaxID=357466 RepID=A0AAD4SAU7_9MAGN|nr:hypothetical protein MKW98_019404 [Papaver atlanticum]